MTSLKCPYCGAELDKPPVPDYKPKVGQTTCSACQQVVYYLNHLNWDMGGYTGRPVLAGRTFPKNEKENEKFRMRAAKSNPSGCMVMFFSAAFAAAGACLATAIFAR
ncbi:MAG: hypothetical protein HY290_27695 [Planctomycetia bacterium]|nr:hypothetical protein [Planctomycetia bacterium]